MISIKTTALICLTAVSTALLLSGCISIPSLRQPAIKTEYYIMEYPPPQAEDKKIPVTIGVKPFTANPPYNSTRIIYKKGNFHTNQYLYHRWHVTPAQMAACLLARDIKNSGMFAGVFGPNSFEPCNWIVEGNIETFLENDTEKQWSADLSVEITLIKGPLRNRRLFMQKTYSTSMPCERNNPRATAHAMSLAMQKISRDIIKDIAGVIEQNL